MNEQKFRAWDKKLKEWYGASNPNILTFYGFVIFGECTLLCTPSLEDLQNLIITQFTGLQDSKGVDIYEGDILRPCRYKGMTQYNFPVVFKDGVFKLTGKLAGYKTLIESLVQSKKSGNQYEVIGNIYENPELLNPSQPTTSTLPV